ncbi:5-carboxymethyl-2-hydroxymuconate isomerase [Acinetobacter sp. NCu2D-2]|uniref:5-carboxymethyl-2-hydroxymuconate Delta-isomerase n=1 Tax=Acinetobacter sp. NCu2D-2 TaxID=1608473 RepID=UPI0007CE05F0|nr:5-carboxymethyl-2-hydroxymuconate Delta-isomerase [Acinetobacter sp. NCu2D-2]ANF82386.1 5-carboxymethyl-2-hydroxymuconate isomerase [Acinetobacter sp. NCu2D-2]
MPHIYLEYSENLKTIETQPILKAINQSMLDGQFVKSADELKSRALMQSDYLVGLGEKDIGYLHVKVALLSGRDDETKAKISNTVLKATQAHFQQPNHLEVQICVEIIEMPKCCYSKVTLATEF